MEPNEVWDNVVDTTKKVGKTIAAVAVDVYEQGKKQINLIQARSELKAAYQALGESHYAETEGVAADAEARAALHDKIKELKAQLAEDGKAAEPDGTPLVCPTCGKVVDADSVFCKGCGAKL